ncbi:TP53 target 3D [Homo sapiens]|uniref:TP53 target 3D n=1 Tax=Homo sapiens TaxID=9606 RepID=H3BT92_HUMAN|nr:hypothetical protein KI723_161733 [Homo sapiens]KAI4054744.1 TP53 target 3D [Homo sapiens]KAI4054745.1 TP53 target 3D [Homo sapiens]
MRASPCISQPAASWHPRPSALRPTAGSGPDTRTPGTVEDGSAPCPAFRSPAVSPCGEEPCCFQISPAEETLELGRLVSPGCHKFSAPQECRLDPRARCVVHI